MNRIAILVINWNGAKCTVECLSKMKLVTWNGYHLYLLDNGSKDQSVVEIQKFLKDWDYQKHPLTFLESPQNLGFAGGCNFLIHEALKEPFEYVFLLNNDAWVEGSCIEVLAEKSQGKALVGPIIRAADSEAIIFRGRSLGETLFGVKATFPGQDTWQAGYLEGSALLIPSEFLRQQKQKWAYYFDPNYFLYCEDVDLSLSAQALGYTTLVTKSATARHRVSVSGGGAGNPYAFYYITRNRLYLVRKWWPVLYPFFVIYYALTRVMIQGIRFLEKKDLRVRAAVWCGLRDGLKAVTGKWNCHDSSS